MKNANKCWHIIGARNKLCYNVVRKRVIGMIHLSDLQKYERCAALLWRSRHEPLTFFPFVHPCASMGELAIRYFDLKNYYEGKIGDAGSRAVQALQRYDALVNARFEAQGVRIRITLMRRTAQGFDVYFGYRSCYPHESEAQKIADQLTVLQTLQIPVANVYILCLNADYIRKEHLNIKELLLVSDRLFNQKNKLRHTIREMTTPLMRDLREMSSNCESCIAQGSCPLIVRSQVCTRKGKCRYFDRCFPQQLPDDSILYLQQSAHKLEMYEEGIERLQDADLDRVEGFRFQFAQIRAAQNQGFAFDECALRTWLVQNITYPITYLDFEWDTYAIPPYEGMRPFDVLCFQYSMHIETEPDAPLLHREFLGEEDCRITFIEQLLRDLPSQGPILVFNMEGAEKLRLIQLAEQFPIYEERLTSICQRMIDLSLLFSAGVVHHVKMHGMYSLKTLLPIFSDHSYQELDISFGMDAVKEYRAMKQCTREERKKIKEQLLLYCGMDTYAEYVLLHGLERLLQKKNGE